MLVRATENAVSGHIWPAGRYLPTPDLITSALSILLSITQARSQVGEKGAVVPQNFGLKC